MQSNIAIALFTKLKSTYEVENRFLAFPPGSISMHYSDFSFLDAAAKTGQELNESLTKAANFAKSTNFIANATTKLSYDDRNLWDIYKSVLEQKELASGKRSPQDKKNIEKLRKYLMNAVIKRPDGTKISRMDNYDIYEKDYYSCLDAYNNQKILSAAEDSSNQNEIERLKRRVENAMKDWILKGAKSEVEGKLDELKGLSSKGPFTTWTEYQDEFDKKRITKTELQGLAEFDFYLTSYFPGDFYLPNSTSWNKFTLDKGEIDSLSRQAPEELKLLISNVPIKSISIEIAYVNIRRPWFHTEIFSARNWKLPEDEIPLSDGGSPASGRMPAIPVAILFARNIKFELETVPGTTHEPDVKVSINSDLFSNMRKINALPATIMPIMTSVRFKREPIEFIQPQSFEMAAPMNTVSPKLESNVSPTEFKNANLARFQFNEPPVAITKNVVLDKTVFESRLKILEESTVNKETKNVSEQPPQSNEEIEILAFVCRKLPKCPDPDLSLIWS